MLERYQRSACTCCYSVDPNGGMRRVFRAAANVDGDPIITPDGALLIGSDDGNIYALRADAIPAQPRTRDAGTPP